MCIKGKQVKISSKSKDDKSTQQPLEVRHLDLLGPTKTAFMSGKRYSVVMVIDYSRWTWVMFLSHKDETSKVLNSQNKFKMRKVYQLLLLKFTMLKILKIKTFDHFIKNNGLNHNFSTPRTPQQNGIFLEKEYIFTRNGLNDA